MVNQASINWCDDTLKRNLPWDDSQFIEVKRLSGRNKRKRQALASVFRVGSEVAEDMEIQMTYDKLKEFEWESSIIDFKLRDSRGKILTFGDPKKNSEIFDHIDGELEKFIDELILEVNKEDKTEVAKPEIIEVEGNSESLLDES